jgi:hypothetical protein
MSNNQKESSRAYQLICQQEDSLETELAVAEVEEIFQRRPEKIKNHGIVVAFGSKPSNKGHPNTTSKSLVDLGFVLELGMLGLDGFKLDSDLFAGDDVDTQVDIACVKMSKWLWTTGGKLRSAPKEPEPIFLPSLYLPPTRRSSLPAALLSAI